MRAPAALLAIPLLAGSVTGVLLFDSAPQAWTLCAAAAAILAVASAAAALADGSAFEATLAIVVGALMAGLSIGLGGAREIYRREIPLPLGEPVVLLGTLREDGVATPNGATITLDVLGLADAAREPAPLDQRVGLRLSVNGTAASAAAGDWRAGRRLRVTATLRPPATYQNFGVPDEARALARRGIALVGSVKSASLVEVVRAGRPFDEAAASARAWSRRRLAESIGRISVRSAAVASAILIGDRSGIPDEDERRLQEAGTYHVIAISGGNIAILTAVLLFFMRLARLPPRAASAATIAALLFYGQVTGAPPSVARAISAAVVYLAARVIDHRGPALNALAVAAAGAVAVFPFAPLDPGFILSFGATLGILVGVPRLVQPPSPSAGVSRARRAVRTAVVSVTALFAATICAETALMPAGAVLFARVTFAGLLLNFIASPLMALVQTASLATLAAGGVPAVGDRAAYIAHLGVVGLVESARLVDVVPWLSIEVLPPALWLVASYYCACVLLLCRRSMKPRPTSASSSAVRRVEQPRTDFTVGQPFMGCLHAIAPIVLALAVTLILLSPGFAQRGSALPPRAKKLRVAFLDVGQGDATLVQLPGGRTVLVDAAGLPGSTFDAGERVVAPALRGLGVGSLDDLVITHADPDHIGGAASVMRRFGPRAIWEGVPVPPNAGLRELSELAAARATVWRTVQAGDVERTDDVDIRVWHPPPPEWERQRVRNDDSVVIELRHGDVSIVLTGDIEREAERQLAPKLQVAPVVVLKAPHHGSATSSSEAFIAAARPGALVISAGRRNPFGHPHPTVVARYRAAGVEIFRTDEDGAVVVDSDGRTATVRTFSGREYTLSGPPPQLRLTSQSRTAADAESRRKDDTTTRR